MTAQTPIRNNNLSKVKVNDTVYHVKYGKCVVINIYPDGLGAHCLICSKNNLNIPIYKDGRESRLDYAPSVWIDESISNIPIIYEDKHIIVKYNSTGEIFIKTVSSSSSIDNYVELRIGTCPEGLQITSYGTFFKPINDGFKVTVPEKNK